MDYSIYRAFGQMQNMERSTIRKPRKHPYYCQHKWTCKDYPECPKWHQTALRLAGVALVLLVAMVIGLTIWISHLRTYSFHNNHGEKTSGIENGTKDCWNIPLRNQQDSTNSRTNLRLNVCPNDWIQEKGKCYKFFKTFESWINSQKSCSITKSHLLMIQDKEELDFIQNHIQDGIYFWIGLNITYPQKTWTWLDGTPLDLQLFQIKGEVEDNACAMITKDGVFSENCLIQSYWICQDVISITTDDD